MKLHTLIALGFALGVSACAEKEQAPVQGHDTEMAKETAVAEVPPAELAEMGSTEFIAHMHHHASQLGRLNAALDVGSLAAAQRPAYWLSGHDEVGAPDAWQVHIKGMRDGANAVSEAPDLATARAAAQRIAESCNACHTAAGIELVSLQPE